jgi:predicted AlkP superfamily pyrophosphatase or phosphodiesterase
VTRTAFRYFVAALLAAAACARPVEPARPRVIFVGLDGADWQSLDPLMADGTMPNLAALVRDSARGPLLTQHPPLSPLVWTTMMTGVSPLRHRILDFTRYNPVTRQREPITSDERAVPAIWNMVSSRGRRVDVVGLWATDPPERVNGTIVSDREIVREGGGSGVERIKLETELRHRRITELIERDHPDLAIVYFDGTDAMGHLLAPDLPRPYFARIDAILGDYRKLAEKTGATLVIASDHGFDWSKPSGKQPADSHREEGTLGKRMYVTAYRGFASHSLRQTQQCQISKRWSPRHGNGRLLSRFSVVTCSSSM